MEEGVAARLAKSPKRYLWALGRGLVRKSGELTQCLVLDRRMCGLCLLDPLMISFAIAMEETKTYLNVLRQQRRVDRLGLRYIRRTQKILQEPRLQLIQLIEGEIRLVVHACRRRTRRC